MKKIIKAVISAMAWIAAPYSVTTMSATIPKSPPATLSSLKNNGITPALANKDGTLFGSLGHDNGQNYLVTVLSGNYVTIPLDIFKCSVNPDSALAQLYIPCYAPVANQTFFYESTNCTGQAYIEADAFAFRSLTGFGVSAGSTAGSTEIFYSTETSVKTFESLSRGNSNDGCTSEPYPVNYGKKVTAKTVIPSYFYLKRFS